MKRLPQAPLACSLCLLLFVLSGCAGQPRADGDTRGAPISDSGQATRPPVSEQSHPLREPDAPYRTVVAGDTLYSIAWESGRDYRELARWNRIAAPYTIKPGQQLRVVPPAAAATSDKPAHKPEAHSAASAGKKGGTAKPPKRVAAPAVRTAPAVTAGKTASAAAKPASAPKPSAAKNSSKPARNPRTHTASTVASSGPVGLWAWPADGQILNRYSESDSKGLDISGARGSPVRAAAGGRVVYQGSGLRGYGQLIIIKHSDDFLSAYAHNDRIYVKEGDVVKRGQKIADMGSSGTDHVRLHFEIRRQGVPIDPLKYLPKR